MKRIGTLVVAACATAITAVFATGTAMAGAAEGSWYIAPQVNALWLDDGRVADDDVGVTLAFGRTLNANWDAEISWYGSEHNRAGDATTRTAGFRIVRQSRVLPRRTRESVLQFRHCADPIPTSSPVPTTRISPRCTASAC